MFYDILKAFSFQHDYHKFQPAVVWFAALLFLNSVVISLGEYLIASALILIEGYIFIILYSLMFKFREELNDLKIQLGEV
jgi:hypothetical protein